MTWRRMRFLGATRLIMLQLRETEKSGHLRTHSCVSRTQSCDSKSPRNVKCVRAPLLHILIFGVCSGLDISAFCMLSLFAFPLRLCSSREGISLRRRVSLGVETHILRVLRNSQSSPPLQKCEGQGRDRAGPGDHHENQDDLRAEG